MDKLQEIMNKSMNDKQSKKKIKRVQEVYNNGTRYVGEKIGDNFHGFGTLTFANGEVYEGEFNENKRNGYGKRFINKNVLIYEGEWQNDRYSGRGILYNPKFKQHSNVSKSMFSDFNKLTNKSW